MKEMRLRLWLPLTRQEIKQLEARAAGEIRSVANYVAWVISEGPQAPESEARVVPKRAEQQSGGEAGRLRRGCDAHHPGARGAEAQGRGGAEIAVELRGEAGVAGRDISTLRGHQVFRRLQ